MISVLTSRHFNLYIPIGLVLANLVFKGLFLINHPIAADEPFSIWVSQMDISSIIDFLSTGNNPPLYEIILHYWGGVFGTSALSMRLPSLIFSSFSVLIIYRLCEKHLQKNTGLIAGILFVFSNYHIFFAHEARSYALLGMLSIGSVYFFLNLIKSEKNVFNKRSLVFFSIPSFLLISCHYFGFLILLTELIFLIINPTLFKQYWKVIGLGIGIVLILYIPNMGVLIDRFTDSTGNGTWVKPPKWDGLYHMLRKFSNQPLVAVCSIVILIASLIKLLIHKVFNQTCIGARSISFWFFFVFLSMFTVSFSTPIFIKRYLMVAGIAFPILLAIASTYLMDKKKTKYIFPCLLCLLFIISSNPNVTNQRDTKGAIQQVLNLKTDRTIIYLCPDWFDLNFTYYYNKEIFQKKINPSKSQLHTALKKDNIYPIKGKEDIDLSLLSNVDQVIFLDAAADFCYPENRIQPFLSSQLNQIDFFHFEKIFNVIVYAPSN